MPIKSALDDFIDQSESVEVSGSVANVQPRVNMPYRLAVIGEAPGADEVREGRPFVGMSGRFLTSLLSKANIIRDACFVGNICQQRPPGNKIELFSRGGLEIQSGLKQLGDDLRAAKPNACLLLGKAALWAALGVDNIGDWRGSWFIGKAGPFQGIKCIASYHPAACLRQYEWTPLLMFDIRKAKDGAGTPDLVVPHRDIRINLSLDELLAEMEKVLQNKPKIGIDIEGGIDSMSCISIATSPSHAFIVPFSRLSGASYWQHEDDEIKVWAMLAKILGDPSIHKVLQYSLYDRFVLQRSYDIVVRGVTDDTLLKHWELYCELEKNLGFLCALYCKNTPYYKQDRKSNDQDTFYRYCCMDSAVTLEISNQLDLYLTDAQRKHYEFNVNLLNPLLYAELRGIRYDTARAVERRTEVLERIHADQYKIDCLAKCGLDYNLDRSTLLAQVRSIMCYKRDSSQPRQEFSEVYQRVVAILLGTTPFTDQDKGFINTACKVHMNTRAPRFKTFLYVTKGLPEQYSKTTEKLTADFEALLRLKKHAPDEPVIDLGISLTMHRTRAQMLAVVPAKDNRMRCSYNIVGSETGRISSSRSVLKVGKKRVGTNMQTVSDDWEIEDEELVLLTEGLRDLYQADEGYYLGQCDLKGSDGWTIGAQLAALGDPTMLDDLRFGLKPAQIVAYILRHGNQSVQGKTRIELKELLKEVKKEDQDYYICKQLIWGACYLMGPRKASEQVFKETYGKIYLGEAKARAFQQAVFARYRAPLWHKACQATIDKQPYPPRQVSASGQVRRFFGRQREILGEWLANEPQQNTTYATMFALYRAWNDPENRVASKLGSRLRVEMLHQVHDALLPHWKIEDTPWAITKIKSWFDNTLTIAGIPIVIPFDGSYGSNWALNEQSKVGSI